MGPGTYILKTLGCKANVYDSQLIEAELQRRGWRPSEKGEPGGARLCIVNSCTVTDEADRQTRKMAARLFRENGEASVVVTGCAAEVDPERLARSRGIHYVIGNRGKPELVDLILRKLEFAGSGRSVESGDPDASAEVLGATQNYSELLSRHPIEREWPDTAQAFLEPPARLPGHSGTTRAFLKIQEGCNSFCTYCIIPYGRGPSRSLEPKEVVARIQGLVEAGTREIVITGTNIGDYGSDWGGESSLSELLRRILGETSIERIRLSSLDPTEITPAIFELVEKDSRLCPHFHVSAQSCSSRILRLMKRRYGFEALRDCLLRIGELPAENALARPFVGMDLITGFPGESDREFEEGYEALAALPWSRLHVFPYSERTGTPATRLPGAVPQARRLERSRILARLSLDRMISRYEEILRENPEIGDILLEKLFPDGSGSFTASGYSPNYTRVTVEGIGEAEARNSLVRVSASKLLIDRAGGEVSLHARLVPARTSA